MTMDMFNSVITIIIMLSLGTVLAEFTHDPKNILPEKTDKITVTCSPRSNDTSDAILAIMIRKSKIVEATTTKEPETRERRSTNYTVREYLMKSRSQRDVNDTTLPILEHTSITGAGISTIPGVVRLEVKGDLRGHPNLTLIIHEPGVEDLGNYECDITYMKSTGLIDVDKQELSLIEGIEHMTMGNMGEYDGRLDVVESQVKMFISLGKGLQGEEVRQKKRIEMLEEEVMSLKKENTEMMSTLAAVNLEMAKLSGNIQQLYSNQYKVTQNVNYPTLIPDTSEEKEDSKLRTNADKMIDFLKGYKQQNHDAYTDVSKKIDHMMSQRHPEIKDDHNGGNSPIKDDMFAVNIGMEEVENTRIHLLEARVEQLERAQISLQETVDDMSVAVNVTMEQRIVDLERITSQESLGLIPAIVGNITELQTNILTLRSFERMTTGEIHKFLEVNNTKTTEIPPIKNVTKEIMGQETTVESEEIHIETNTTKEPPQVTESETSLDLRDIYRNNHPLARSCYICGDNSTQTYCTRRTHNNIDVCVGTQSMCITDVYQSGHFRYIYKRCGDISECEDVIQKSDPRCATETFIRAPKMECHFCCTTNKCNDGIRPSKSLYNSE